MPHNLGKSLTLIFLHTVAEPGLTQVFSVSTSKIQFFRRSRASPWHQPSWMTQSTKAECIPMAPRSAHPPLLPACSILFLTLSISIQPELVAEAPQSTGNRKHGHLPALSLTSSPGGGACFMQDFPLPRSTDCPTLARGQCRPATATAPNSSLGATPLP